MHKCDRRCTVGAVPPCAAKDFHQALASVPFRSVLFRSGPEKHQSKQIRSIPVQKVSVPNNPFRSGLQKNPLCYGACVLDGSWLWLAA